VLCVPLPRKQSRTMEWCNCDTSLFEQESRTLHLVLLVLTVASVHSDGGPVHMQLAHDGAPAPELWLRLCAAAHAPPSVGCSWPPRLLCTCGRWTSGAGHVCLQGCRVRGW